MRTNSNQQLQYLTKGLHQTYTKASSFGSIISPSISCIGVSSVQQGAAVFPQTCLDSPNVLEDGNLERIVAKRVHHTHSFEQLDVFGQFLQQEMRQDLGPFVVITLEFGLQSCDIAMGD